MDLGLSGRVAIVTGASAGIGFAIAEELVVNGASVVIAARDACRLQKAEAELRKCYGADVASIAVDVSTPEAAAQIVETAITTFGTLDILVNNARRAHAGGLTNSIEDNIVDAKLLLSVLGKGLARHGLPLDPDDWEEIAGVKLTSMRRLCEAAIPHMRDVRWGRIVNMTSIGAFYPNPKLFVSHVLSAAISNLTKSLALEVAGDGILVNAVGIGAVVTENWGNNMVPEVRRTRPEFESLSDDEVLARISAELTPVGRAGKASEIAAITAFLASDRNGYVTGETIEASGGADRFI